MASIAWQITLFAISGSSIEFTEFQLAYTLHSLSLSHDASGQGRLGKAAYQMRLHDAIIVTSNKRVLLYIEIANYYHSQRAIWRCGREEWPIGPAPTEGGTMLDHEPLSRPQTAR